jgi:hypothetical protein
MNGKKKRVLLNRLTCLGRVFVLVVWRDRRVVKVPRQPKGLATDDGALAGARAI